MDQLVVAQITIEIFKTVALFILLSGVPLILVTLIKRINWQHPIILKLNRCIRHGTGFGERDCMKVDEYITEIKNSFALIKGNDFKFPQKAAPINIAFKALPLLECMSKENTCCAIHVDQMPPFQHVFACKQRLEELFEQWSNDDQLPLVPQRIKEIKRISAKIENAAFYYRLKIILTLAIFLICSFWLTNVILKETPAWKIEVIAYLASLFFFTFNYDYYYSNKFNRYEKNLLVRWFK